MLLRLYCDDGEHEHGTEYFEFYDGKFIVKCRNGYIKEYADVKAIMCKDVAFHGGVTNAEKFEEIFGLKPDVKPYEDWWFQEYKAPWDKLNEKKRE